MSNWPPQGEQCEGPYDHSEGEGPDACAVGISIENPPSSDPGGGVGSSVLCWTMPSSGPFTPSISPGSCNPDSPCEYSLTIGLNIEPTGSPDPKDHYEFWHGEGTYGPPRVRSGSPKWAAGSNSKFDFGPPFDGEPNGSSVLNVTISASVKCGTGQTTTIIAIPANGKVSDSVSITITPTCSECG